MNVYAKNSTAEHRQNSGWRLKARPSGQLRGDEFEWFEEPLPDLPVDAVLVRNLYLSIDPTHRIWMSDIDQYMRPVQLGEVMRATTVGVVEQSGATGLNEGQFVTGFGGWQMYWLAKPHALSKVQPSGSCPVSTFLGPMGVAGATAYFGLFDIGRPKEGETVVVSAAAGAVGSLVGQMAKLTGCRVIGISGSRTKCEWTVQELGFDDAINYRGGDLASELKTKCPAGIDVYFDNVGGEILNAALGHVRVKARVVICGMVSTYDRMSEPSTFDTFRNVLMKRAKIEGFIVSDYYERWPEATAAIESWIDSGLIKYRMDIRSGIANAPRLLKEMLEGANMGKLVVRI